LSARSSRIRFGALAVGALLVASCGFPDFNFVPDDEFYGSGGAVGGAGGAVGGAGSGGVGGGGSGGVSGGGVGGGGTGGGGVGGGGTGGGSGGGTGGGVGGGGTGGGSGAENCTNGVDDDGDSKVDCEDTDCQSGFTCAPGAPSGWTGPVAMFEGAAPAPDCLQSGGYNTIKQNASSDLKPGSAACPSCACTSPTGMTCTGDVWVYEDTSCTGLVWTTSTSPPIAPTDVVSTADSCSTVSLCHGADDAGTYKPSAVKLENVQISGGTCTPQPTGTKNVPTPTWDKVVRACGDAAGSGKGCGTAGSCLPRPKTPFGTGLCIYKDGDQPCPSGAYSTKKLTHKSFADTRDCSACACGSAGGGSCSNAQLKSYTDACSSGEQTVALNQCVALSNDPTTGTGSGCPGFPTDTRGFKLTATPSGATCPPSGGQVTGSAAGSEPITFCCL
jgi:hypothetical protein